MFLVNTRTGRTLRAKLCKIIQYALHINIFGKLVAYGINFLGGFYTVVA
jgi:hypothetical protein